MPRHIDLEALCAEKGLRITDQRRVIARVLSDAEDHPDVEKVYERASAIDPGISIATVYRPSACSKRPAFWIGTILGTAALAMSPRPRRITTI